MRTPEAKRVPHVWSRPTGDVTDHYAWLADRDDPDTISYLEAENAYADAYFADREQTVEDIFGEIKSRVQETDESAPVPEDDWFYVRRTEEGRDYVILSRGRSAESATDQTVLDVNVEAQGTDFFSLGMLDVSPDHRLVAWSADTDGSEKYTIRVRDIESGADLDDTVAETSASGSAWSADNSHLFYVLPDEQQRPYRVMRHQLGTPASADVEVYRDDDERFFVGVGGSRSGQWIMIGSGSKQSSEVWVIPADDPTADPRLVRAREDELEYSVSHWGEVFVITTNADAEDFRVMTAPIDAPGDWTELLPHEPGRRIVSVQTFEDHLAVLSWRDMRREVEVRFPRRLEPCHRGARRAARHLLQRPTRNYATTTLRVSVESMSVPRTVYDVDVETGQATLIKRVPTPNVDLDAYVAERLWATAEDGTRVPVDVVRHRDTPIDGTAPCLLYGYGSYEISIPTAFSVIRLSLLDRGVTFALAHPRGGGEGGRRWYTGGKLLNKRNTFTDTLAVADHLVEAGWSAPDRLAIRGGSAGGLPRRRVHDDAAGSLRRRDRRGAVRRHRHHDERSEPSADGDRVGGVGGPAPGTACLLHAQLLALRQHGPGRLPRGLHHCRPERPPGCSTTSPRSGSPVCARSTPVGVRS